MTCNRIAPGVIVCTTPTTRYRKMIDCPVCKTRRRVTRTFGGWYGDNVCCCGCGHVWSDGYRVTRFRSAKAKAKAIALARERWWLARPASEYRLALDEFISTYRDDAS